MLEARTGRWTRIPPRPTTAYDETVAAAGRDLFVFGGQDWGEQPPDGSVSGGELVAEAWLWGAPE